MDEEQTAREQQILALMGQRMRVTLSDKRIVYGKLNCVDSALNLIMVDNEILLPSGATPRNIHYQCRMASILPFPTTLLSHSNSHKYDWFELE
jgi:small nuclear ribonucleoprotein (snRNP)-like protein